jgi:hypothetical protein
VESQNELLAYMDKGEMASCQNRWTFEAAWEVANKGEKVFYYTCIVACKKCEGACNMSHLLMYL